MSDLIQLLVSGLALGAVYALIALGFVVIYRASQVFNFAQGELLSMGAFLTVGFASMLSGWLPESFPGAVSWGLSVLLAMLCTGVIAAGVERGVMRPLIGRPVFVSAILTIFVGFFLRAMVIIVWGVEPRGMPTPWDTMSTVDVAGAKLLYNSLATIVAGALTLAAFFVVIRYTKFGVAMRATSLDQEAALAHGIPVGRIMASTWFLSGMFAALGGVFLGMFPSTVDANIGLIALKAFPAVILGGLESALGAVIAGLMLGVLEVLAQAYLNPALGEFGHNFHGVFPYLVMIVVLIVRPYGLLGREEVERV
jgi:branched-chain amino acid transport system permease protein